VGITANPDFRPDLHDFLEISYDGAPVQRPSLIAERKSGRFGRGNFVDILATIGQRA
jgi:hypothetical protein